MNRDALEHLGREELIGLVLRMQRPAKPGGAKPGHEGHFREAAVEADIVVDCRPEACPHWVIPPMN